MEIWLALSIGLLGSLHCVGMCGPIALALPLDRSNSWTIFSGNLFYSAGRILSYFSIGIFFGLLGKSFQLIGLQQYLSITIGLIIILGVISQSNLFSMRLPGFYYSFVNRIQSRIQAAFQRRSKINLFNIGFINGFLPCGLVYMAIAGAISSPSPVEGGLFMAVFGLGTLPLMWAVGVFGGSLSMNLGRRLKQYLPYFIFLLGVLFILRGSNLDIPYLSPALVEDTQNLNCH